MSETNDDKQKTDTNLELDEIKSENIDDVLMSFEKLDRASPELWPEQIPGVKDFVAMNTPTLTSSPPAWSHGLTQEDLNAMHQLGALSTAGLVQEVKKLYDQTYQLGVQEAKEMTRGKYLNIFNANGTTSNGVAGGSASGGTNVANKETNP